MLSKEKIKNLAYFDELTELPNRVHFIDTISDMILKDYGCDIIQGYYISNPLPGEEAIKLL
jgi:predicted signal transduction protein with EAL and GGDEF domain